MSFDVRYPSFDDLRKKAKSRVPGFVFDYLDGGCNEEVNLQLNRQDLLRILLEPVYLTPLHEITLQTKLWDEVYEAPLGIAPIGLQGLIWPGSPNMLARAAVRRNIPFILSTVSTASIEEIGDITSGKFWFQLYHPAEDKMTDDLLHRAARAGCETLVLLADVPSFGFRPRDIRNGLAMPPRMTLKNISQMITKPGWSLQTLKWGVPQFKSLLPYIPKGLNMGQLGAFMNKSFDGRLTEEKIRRIRSIWKGKLVVKGIASISDTQKLLNLGVDGLIVSNHGGRQLDAAESAIASLERIKGVVADRIPVMIDSGIRSGSDLARVFAAGADFAFLGRSFMYATAALGHKGPDHAISLLEAQLYQILQQVGCQSPRSLPNRRIAG